MAKKRTRPTLLVLLWIWAASVFLILDLFLNISEFDRHRPRAPIYRGMRSAAHKMVGEPYYDSSQSVAARQSGGARVARLVKNRRLHGRLVEGQKEGVWVWRHRSGAKQAREEYRSGRRHGCTTRWSSA